MAAEKTRNPATTAMLRAELQAEREALAASVDALRGSADPVAPLRGRLPLVLAVAFGAGFLLSGGAGATARLVFRRRREGRMKARLGPLELVKRR
jgi:hypothetical protein